jgi:hypothetical protein
LISAGVSTGGGALTGAAGTGRPLGGDAVRGPPHSPQNFCVAGLAAPHAGHDREAVLRLLGEGHQADVDERLRDVALGRDLVRIRGRIRDVHQHDLGRRLGLEGQAPGHQLVHDDADRVEVAPGIDLLRADDGLRRDVRRSAEQRRDVGLERVLRLGGFHEAEVDDLHRIADAAALAEDDVRRLHVAVDEASAVRLGEGACDLAEDVDHPVRRHRAVLRHEALEVRALEIFHRVVEDARRGTAVIVYRDRIGMREATRLLDLTLEARDRVVAGALRREHLDGGGAAEEHVLREEDAAHAALADLLLEDVLAELLGDRGRAPEAEDHPRSERRDADDGEAPDGREGEGLEAALGEAAEPGRERHRRHDPEQTDDERAPRVARDQRRAHAEDAEEDQRDDEVDAHVEMRADEPSLQHHRRQRDDREGAVDRRQHAPREAPRARHEPPAERVETQDSPVDRGRERQVRVPEEDRAMDRPGDEEEADQDERELREQREARPQVVAPGLALEGHRRGARHDHRVGELRRGEHRPDGAHGVPVA